ncbi:hypothetical protein B0O80DRAFT_491667 [Mortierella sp. GBAus27b]|nr:hypothetical protein B0O80DRAFT_491667 [Mortierella sp. GBAus27b]
MWSPSTPPVVLELGVRAWRHSLDYFLMSLYDSSSGIIIPLTPTTMKASATNSSTSAKGFSGRGRVARIIYTLRHAYKILRSTGSIGLLGSVILSSPRWPGFTPSLQATKETVSENHSPWTTENKLSWSTNFVYLKSRNGAHSSTAEYEQVHLT